MFENPTVHYEFMQGTYIARIVERPNISVTGMNIDECRRILRENILTASAEEGGERRPREFPEDEPGNLPFDAWQADEHNAHVQRS
jgi:hypothetical protein